MTEAARADKQDKRRQTLTTFVKAEAAALGFDLCRITRPDAMPLAPQRLQAFLDAGYQGTMDWMADTKDRRADPRAGAADRRRLDRQFGGALHAGRDRDAIRLTRRRDGSIHLLTAD